MLSGVTGVRARDCRMPAAVVAGTGWCPRLAARSAVGGKKCVAGLMMRAAGLMAAVRSPRAQTRICARVLSRRARETETVHTCSSAVLPAEGVDVVPLGRVRSCARPNK